MKLCNKNDAPEKQRSMEIGHVLLSYRSKGNAGTLFEKSREREFVVHSGASMHMLSKKGFKLS